MKKKVLKLFGFIIFFFIFSTFLYAGRPLKTDDAETVERGKFEFEIGYDFIKNDNGTENQEFGFSLKCGLINWMDLGICVPFVIEEEDEDINGCGNIEIGTKFSILKESEKTPGIAFTISATPNPDEGDIRYALNFILTKKFGKLTTHLNLGKYSVKGESENILTYRGAFEYSINEKLNLCGEIVGEKNEESQLELLLGINYSINEILTYDIGASFGLNDDTPDYRITTGITLTW